MEVVEKMNLDELKLLKAELMKTKKINQKDLSENHKYVDLGSIIVYNGVLGITLCTLTDNEKNQFGIKGVKLNSEAGQKLWLSSIGEEFSPENKPLGFEKTSIINILTVNDLIDIVTKVDSNKIDDTITESDIVLGEDDGNVELYKAGGNSFRYVAGLTNGNREFHGENIGNTVSLPKKKVKVLGAITERKFACRIRNN